MAAVALSNGTEIGGFRLQNVIGRGGFGITYRAEEKNSGQVYAIKEYLPEDFAERAETGYVSASFGHGDTYERGLQAFITEANILKELPRRKGLVRVRGAFERSGTAYCVMEFIEGDSLDRMAQRLIRTYGHIPQALLVELVTSVCWALEALHREHLIHRDVKPANIMLRRNGEPVLIDFGAARRLSRREKKEMIFTRSYAAIEQIPPEMSGFGRDFAEGPWTDLYALSVVLYQLVARKLPPDAMTRARAVLSGRSDPYEPLSQKQELTQGEDAYDPEFLEAIDHGCGLMPKQRIQNASYFAERIAPDAWKQMQQNQSDEAYYTEEEDWTMDAQNQTHKPRAKLLLLCSVLIASAFALLYYVYDIEKLN
ncbi:serine/threonine-protein kinase [uncultured Roseovarius sp.]|uniref:serine/threonine protein kinase n=1 Tax=uncultured Roseovarius sp. TaxID=293344 RepID=UPI002615AB51|nr:serine/threonine-protein kinase [uncultured Roseovarius sp.]